MSKLSLWKEIEVGHQNNFSIWEDSVKGSSLKLSNSNTKSAFNLASFSWTFVSRKSCAHLDNEPSPLFEHKKLPSLSNTFNLWLPQSQT